MRLDISMCIRLVAGLAFSGALSLFICSGVSGAEIKSLEGVMEKGERVVLHGHGFGVLEDNGGDDPYLSYLWEDCEYDGGFLSNPKFNHYNYSSLSADEPRANSLYSIRHDVLESDPGADYINAFGQTRSGAARYGLDVEFENDVPVLFVSVWIKPIAPFGMNDGADQAKLLGVAFPHLGSYLKTWVHIDGGPDQSNPDGWQIGTHVLESNRNDSQVMLNEGEWGRLDFFLDRTSDIYRVWFDGQLVRDVEHVDDMELDHLRFMQYARNDAQGNISFLLDDHYVNFSQARIELGNSAQYADSKHKEIQLPLGWTNDSVSFQVNPGSFQSDEDLYLYVIDSSGQASEGYGPIRLGDAEESAAPVIDRVSGSIKEGRQIVIHGEGFGSTGPEVRVFDDFERGVVGEPLSMDATLNNWTTFSQSYIPLSSGVARSGSRSQNAIDKRQNFPFAIDFPYTTEVFVSYGVRIPEGRSFPATDIPYHLPVRSAWKWSWLWDAQNPGRAGGNDDICLPTYTGGGMIRTSGNDLQFIEDQLGTFVKDPHVTGEDPYNWFSFNHWMRQTFWLRDGDGTIYWQALKEGVLQVAETEKYGPGGIIDAPNEGFGCPDDCWDPAPAQWNQIRFPGWSAPETNTQAVYDDIYVATGPNAAARIEMGDSAEYRKATKLAVLTPETWGENSITATVRMGPFKDGDQVFVYVIDGENNPSTGYGPIRLGTPIFLLVPKVVRP